MKRPDTGTRRNMIMEMAASIMQDKYESHAMIIEMLEEQNKKADTVAILKKEKKAMASAIKLMDERAGCWG